ncbi:hypothetical protein K474DRAFT_1668219 [Panus rudis PR-1116 ss-1]|nr:hypothetical protein K474DRAFT_1668219 [Panus rudis PR-1116 ss-1]
MYVQSQCPLWLSRAQLDELSAYCNVSHELAGDGPSDEEFEDDGDGIQDSSILDVSFYEPSDDQAFLNLPGRHSTRIATQKEQKEAEVEKEQEIAQEKAVQDGKDALAARELRRSQAFLRDSAADVQSDSDIAANEPPDLAVLPADVSFLSSVADKKSLDRYCDHALVHIHVTPIPADQPEEDAEEVPESDKRRTDLKTLIYSRQFGLRVVHRCLPLLLENKKGPPRNFLEDEKAFMKGREQHINTAVDGLLEYVAVCFERDLCATQVIAVAASGIYWRWRVVQRTELPPLPAILTYRASLIGIEALHGEDSQKVAAFLVSFETKNCCTFRLGTDESDREWMRLRDTALIPILNEHKPYPSTMLPTPRQTAQEENSCVGS